MTLDEYIDSLRAKRIAVVGAGVSNLPLVSLLRSRGCDVTVCDKRTAEELGTLYGKLRDCDVKLRLGGEYLKGLDFDVVFRTPGLHPMFLEDARRRGAVITSEMEAFFALCPCKTIAVTGSDGKTTTSTLISELLTLGGYRVHLGGNIGRPLLCEVPDMKPEDVAVLELSSFQLHSMVCRPDVAVVTNISPNHLDVHPSLEDYIAAKKNVFLGQQSGDRLVLNRDNEITAAFAKEAKADILWFSRRERVEPGYYCADGAVWRGGERVVGTEEILLPGVHNIENLMAAFAAVDGMVDLGVCREVARTFGGVEHRLELVRELHGVKFYNDSIASSPTRTIAGLRSFRQKVILIAGGHDKNIPFDGLAEEITGRVKALFLTGETAKKIEKAVLAAPDYDADALPVRVIGDFREAVLAAAASAAPGDVVILSPACSSFDKFKNFVERGDTFKKIVEGLE